MKYRQNKYGNAVQISSETDDKVSFCNLGGGFIRWLPPEEFYSQYDREWVPSWRQVNIGADWMDVTLKAWSTGMRWNGWAIPFFELDQALEAANHLPDLVWHPDRDCFEQPDEWGEDGQDFVTYPGTVIEVDGRSIKVYQIGDGWCWDHLGDGTDVKVKAYTFEATKKIVITVEAETYAEALVDAALALNGGEYEASFHRAEPDLKLIDEGDVT